MVSVLSHLQLKNDKWSAYVAQISSKNKTPLAYVKEMAGWKNRPSIAPEFPIVKIHSTAFLDKSLWNKTTNSMSGVIYYESSQTDELIIGHDDNPFINITINDTPLLIASGGPHSKASQNTFTVKKGINKIEYSILQSKQYKKRVNTNFSMYLATKTGSKPEWVNLPNSKKEQKRYQDTYEKQQLLNWKEYAVTTFKQNCANCHAVETKAVGPALKGLIGKKQTVTLANGKKKEVVINEEYIKRSIVNPTFEYPEGTQPIMPKMPLSDKEIDALTRWIVELK